MNTIDFLPLIGLSENETKNQLSTLLKKNEFPELDEDGLSLKSEGIILFFDENRRVESVAFFCTDNADYYEFKGLLPNGINFGDSAETVEEKLGEPSWRSKGRTTFKDHGITVPRTFSSFVTAYYFNGISWLFFIQ